MWGLVNVKLNPSCANKLMLCKCECPLASKWPVNRGWMPGWRLKFNLSSWRQWKDYQWLIAQIMLDLAASPVNLFCLFHPLSWCSHYSYFSEVSFFMFTKEALICTFISCVFFCHFSFLFFNSNLWIQLIWSFQSSVLLLLFIGIVVLKAPCVENKAF